MAPQFFGGGRSLSEWTLSSHITFKKRQTTPFFPPTVSPHEPNIFDYDKNNDLFFGACVQNNQFGDVDLPVALSSHGFFFFSIESQQPPRHHDSPSALIDFLSYTA